MSYRSHIGNTGYWRAPCLCLGDSWPLEWAKIRSNLDVTHCSISWKNGDNDNFIKEHVGRQDSYTTSASATRVVSGLEPSTSYDVAILLSTDESYDNTVATLKATLDTSSVSVSQDDRPKGAFEWGGGYKWMTQIVETVSSDSSGDIEIQLEATDSASDSYIYHPVCSGIWLYPSTSDDWIDYREAKCKRADQYVVTIDGTDYIVDRPVHGAPCLWMWTGSGTIRQIGLHSGNKTYAPPGASDPWVVSVGYDSSFADSTSNHNKTTPIGIYDNLSNGTSVEVSNV